MYRRSSYASVAAGTAAAGRPSFSPPSRPGANVYYEPTDSSDSTPQQIRRQSGVDVDMEGLKSSLKTSDGQKQGGIQATLEEQPFIIPSYLKHCRHVERLHAAHKVRIQKMREARLAPPPPSGLGSRKASSSNLSIHKVSSSYGNRAPVQDVIERLPPIYHDEEELRPLPSKWSDTDKCVGLELLNDGTEIKFQGTSKQPDDAAAARTDHPMPKECGIYYFEVTILSKGKEGLIGIGLSGTKPNLNRLPGWEQESWAYHGDDGFSFACSASGKPYGPKFSALDVIGCGVDFKKGTAFFTKNGVYLGDAFHNIRAEKLYPSVGIKKPGEHLRINLGQSPFVFDIETMIAKARLGVMSEVYSTDMSRFPIHPQLDESTAIQELISQYLTHEGYVETAKSFTQDVQAERQSLSGGQQTIRSSNPADDVDAINRQKIRAAILEGDIDRAFKYLGAYYPHVLGQEDNRDIYFRLRCRKFIEMIRQSNESVSSNGHTEQNTTQKHGGYDSDVFDRQMELDDQLQRETQLASVDPAEAMDTSADPLKSASETKSSAMKHHNLLNEAIEYGMQLQAEFSGDPRKEVRKALNDTFALIAYTDARDSVLAEMMEGKGRVEIAEQVNGAILVSLGKPRSALLEKMCAQTEVLVNMLAKEGGPATFVNVQKDFMKDA